MPKRIAPGFWEILPAALSWGIIFFLAALAFLHPAFCALFLVSFDFYWIIRTLYLTVLLVLARRRLAKEGRRNCLAACCRLPEAKGWPRLYQLVIFPVYREGPEVLRASLRALADCDYPKDRMLVAVSFEKRNPDAFAHAAELEKEFGGEFFFYLSAMHPDGIAGEGRTKGANATWAARQAKEFLDSRGIGYERVVVSCFDADTCVAKEYFSCLSWHFLTQPKPHQASYQPVPVYNNNIWQAPSFALLVEITSSFCQMIEGVRPEKFVTFSSHSMSFQTLVEVGYWPLDMVSDDSLIYWKAFLFFNGDYRVIPLYTTVSMDAAFCRGLLPTVILQYKQKRRWAWGVENFPFAARGFLANRHIPLAKKIRRGLNMQEGHVTWAVWAVILVIISPLPVVSGGAIFGQTAIGFNLPKITGFLFNFTLLTSLAMVILSRSILPPRPRGVSRLKNLLMIVEWLAVPLIIAILGSLPALDAQTRLALGRRLRFNPTPKGGKVI